MASRKRPTAPGNEEASTVLNLGELSDSQPLSVAEARLVMHSILDNRKKNNPNLLRETDVMNRTMDHVDFFARHRDQQSVEQVSLTLQGLRDLENFERSKLGDLCPENAEEAKTLIPSLTNKVGDADLDAILKEIGNLRAFGE